MLCLKIESLTGSYSTEILTTRRLRRHAELLKKKHQVLQGVFSVYIGSIVYERSIERSSIRRSVATDARQRDKTSKPLQLRAVATQAQQLSRCAPPIDIADQPGKTYSVVEILPTRQSWCGKNEALGVTRHYSSI